MAEASGSGSSGSSGSSESGDRNHSFPNAGNQFHPINTPHTNPSSNTESDVEPISTTLSTERVQEGDDDSDMDIPTPPLLPVTPTKTKGKGKNKSMSAMNTPSSTGTPAKKRGRPKNPTYTKAKVEPKAITVEERKKALAENVEGVRVIGRIGSITVLAGYLQLPDTNELHKMFHTPVYHAILEDFTTSKANGFGCPSLTAFGYKATSIFTTLKDSVTDHWEMIEEATHRPHAQSGLDAQTYGYVRWLHAMLKVIRAEDECYQKSFQIVGEDDIDIRGITVENWNRALHFLRVWSDLPNKEPILARKRPNFIASVPIFLDSVDIGGLREEETVTALPAHVEFMQRLLDAQIIEKEPGDLKNMTLDDFMMRMATVKEVKSSRVDRAPISRSLTIKYLKDMAARYGKVIHDAPRKLSSKLDPAGMAVQTDITDKSKVSENLKLSLPSHINEDSFYKSIAEVEAFWQRMAKASTVSVTPPSFNESCVQRGFDPNSRTKPGLHLTYKHWQITDIAWMCEQEKGPIGGGIIANECGLGKTIEIYGLIHERYLDARKLFKSNEETGMPNVLKYRPTVVLCPSAVLNVHLKDSDLFGRELKIHLYFGTASSLRPTRQRQLIPPKSKEGGDGLQDFIGGLDPNDPETSRVVILCSYTTWQKRTTGVRELDEDGKLVRNLSPSEIMMYFMQLKKTKGPEDESDSEDESDEEGVTAVKTQGKLTKANYNNTFEVFSTVEGKISRICLDDGHACKNPYTRAHQSVKLIGAEYHWMVTATPMMNRVEDLVGTLNLLWKDEWALDGHFDRYSSYEEDFEPPRSSFDIDSDEYNQWVGERLWILNPCTFRSMGGSKGFTESTSRLVVKPILEKIQLRRTMLTEIEVDGEETVRIRDQIPPFTSRVVELDAGNAWEESFFTLYGDLVKKLIVPKENSNLEGANPISARPNEIEKTPGDDTAMNLKVHRRLCHANMNPFLDRLTSNIEKSNVEQINEYYNLNDDKGASFFFRMTRLDVHCPVPTERPLLAYYMAAMSPKINWIGGYLAEHALSEKRERVLVIGDWPLSQWLMEAYFSLLGLKVLSIRSEMSRTERQEIADKFNDPEYPCDLLLVPGRLGGLGLNFQNACHRVILPEQFVQVNLDIQCGGRVQRLGQKRQQDIVQLMINHSYDQKLLLRKFTKFMKQIACEGYMDPESNLSSAQQAEDIIRDLIGLRLKVSGWSGTDYYSWDDIEQDEPSSSTGHVYNMGGLALQKWRERNWKKRDEERDNFDREGSPGDENTTKDVTDQGDDAHMTHDEVEDQGEVEVMTQEDVAAEGGDSDLVGAKEDGTHNTGETLDEFIEKVTTVADADIPEGPRMENEDHAIPEEPVISIAPKPKGMTEVERSMRDNQAMNFETSQSHSRRSKRKAKEVDENDMSGGVDGRKGGLSKKAKVSLNDEDS